MRKDGTLKDYFAPSNALWLWKMDLDMQVTPALFDYKGHKLLATSCKEAAFSCWIGTTWAAPIIARRWSADVDVQRRGQLRRGQVWGSLGVEGARGTRWC
jgi:hypothetical protein